MSETPKPLLPQIVYWAAVIIAGLWAAFILSKWIEAGGFWEPRFEGDSFIRISFLISAPVAIFLALLLRSGAVIWIYVLHFGHNTLPLLFAQREVFGPADALFSLIFLHPLAIAVQIATLIYLFYTGQLRRP